MTVLPVYRLADLTAQQRRVLLDRATAQVFDPELAASMRAIIEDVRDRGDAALIDALARHDRLDVAADELRVPVDEIARAHADTPEELLRAIRLGIANIRAFNEHVLEHASWQAEIAPGLLVGEQARPVASAGLFVPGGKGSFPSVLMHIGTPAVRAGVPEIVVLVPPSPGTGRVDPAVLAVAAELGLDRVFRVNGPAGIAAAAFGTETIPQVVKIVGPGSPAVASTQVQLQAYGCTTATLFGPSESVVIADENADPSVLAADVLTEAEHGPDSPALLVTPSVALVAAVEAELERRLSGLPTDRRGFAQAGIQRYGGAIVVRDLQEACSFANEYAPEHLQIVTENSAALLPLIEHAGEILLGDTPFAAGNYLIGVPNTLPTGRYARVTSGVTARTFLKTSSIGSTTREALADLAPGILALAEHEGFTAHAAAIRARRFPA
jgi:histidinol dehydrogenase